MFSALEKIIKKLSARKNINRDIVACYKNLANSNGHC